MISPIVATSGFNVPMLKKVSELGFIGLEDGRI